MDFSVCGRSSACQGQQAAPARPASKPPKVTIPEEEELSLARVDQRKSGDGRENGFDEMSIHSEHLVADLGQRSTRCHFDELHSCIRC